MNNPCKNLHAAFSAAADLNAYEKTEFPVAEAKSPGAASLSSLASRQRYASPHWTHKYRNLSNLKPYQVQNLHLADQHAQKIGLPLNTFVTVAWALTSHLQIDPAAFRKCLNRVSQWLRRSKVQPTYIYVHENPATPVQGDTKPNTHLLIHIPKRLMAEFKANASAWFDTEMDGAVQVDPRSTPGYRGQDRRLQYMCKGADYFTCRRYGGHRARQSQGIVWSKRSGVSQNIGWSARSKDPARISEMVQAAARKAVERASKPSVDNPLVLDQHAHSRLYADLGKLPKPTFAQILTAMSPDMEQQAIETERYRPGTGWKTLLQLLQAASGTMAPIPKLATTGGRS